MLKTPKIQIMDWPRGKSFSQRQLNSQKMSEPRMSTAICHLLLAGSSAWTCRTLHNAGQIQWAYGTLGLYFAKSVVGILRYGNRYGYEIASLYNFVEMWSIAIGIPFIASDLYFLLHYSYSLSIFHAFLGFVLVAGIVIGTHYMILSYLSLILIGSLLSVVVVGFLNENYWAMAGALSYSVNLYGIKHHGTIGRVPSVDLYTVGLCFFNYFIYKALTDVSIF
ncbi:hypothetical protein R5R35_007881 [Gryllus longicercus]|uniref:Uncharacterized protein n=1 Tax=Gryllus longicercus TaxID=2509291 RepID=A0AAN9VCI6_9ORTH